MALYVNESGPATAPTIVFLHGGGISGWMWQPQVEQLSDYHCLIPDLPEHGQSVDEKPYAMKDTVVRVMELIRARAHGGHAHVVGLSLGAQTTVGLLATAPEVVDHAILSGTLVRPLPGLSLVNTSVKMYMPFKDIDFLIRANLQSQGIPKQYFPQFKEDTRVLTADGMARVFTENMRFSLPTGLDHANMPTLVLVGQKEYGVMRQSARDLIKALPNAKGFIALGVGHAWNLQAPDLFTRTVRTWITDQPLPQELLALK